jgi:hypothetical protein
MCWRWNKCSKWATRRARRLPLPHLQICRVSRSLCWILKALKVCFGLRRMTSLRSFSRWTPTSMSCLTRCSMCGMAITCFKPSCFIRFIITRRIGTFALIVLCLTQAMGLLSSSSPWLNWTSKHFLQNLIHYVNQVDLLFHTLHNSIM